MVKEAQASSLDDDSPLPWTSSMVREIKASCTISHFEIMLGRTPMCPLTARFAIEDHEHRYDPTEDPYLIRYTFYIQVLFPISFNTENEPVPDKTLGIAASVLTDHWAFYPRIHPDSSGISREAWRGDEWSLGGARATNTVVDT